MQKQTLVEKESSQTPTFETPLPQTPASLDELFARDPMELTAANIEEMVKILQARYSTFQAADAVKKSTPKKKALSPAEAGKIDLATLGLL